MTARRVLRATARSRSARPADATATLFQTPLTAWLADWKARKTRTSVPDSSPTRRFPVTAITSP